MLDFKYLQYLTSPFGSHMLIMLFQTPFSRLRMLGASLVLGPAAALQPCLLWSWLLIFSHSLSFRHRTVFRSFFRFPSQLYCIPKREGSVLRGPPCYEELQCREGQADFSDSHPTLWKSLFFGADLYDMPWMVDEMSTREPEHDLENELILALKNPSVSRPTCLRSDLYSYGRWIADIFLIPTRLYTYIHIWSYMCAMVFAHIKYS